MKTRTHAFVSALELCNEIVLKCLDAANETVGAGDEIHLSETLAECENLADEKIVISFAGSVTGDDWEMTARLRRGKTGALTALSLKGRLVNGNVLTKNTESVPVPNDARLKELADCDDEFLAYLAKSVRYLAPPIVADILNAVTLDSMPVAERKKTFDLIKPSWGAMVGATIAELVDDYLDHLTLEKRFDLEPYEGELFIIPMLTANMGDTLVSFSVMASEGDERGEVTVIPVVSEFVNGKTVNTLLGKVSFGHDKVRDGAEFHLSGAASSGLSNVQLEVFNTAAEVTTKIVNDRAVKQRNILMH